MPFEWNAETLVVAGDLDDYDCVDIGVAISDAAGPELTIEFGSVTFCGAGCVGFVAVALQRGLNVTLTRTPPAVRRALELVGLDAHVTMIEDVVVLHAGEHIAHEDPAAPRKRFRTIQTPATAGPRLLPRLLRS
jgi:anti-anti-sigma regulatory factor